MILLTAIRGDTTTFTVTVTDIAGQPWHSGCGSHLDRARSARHNLDNISFPRRVSFVT